MTAVKRRFTCGEFLHGDHPDLASRPYYAIATFLMCESEFQGQLGEARALGDLVRSEENYPLTIIEFIKQSVNSANTGIISGSHMDVFYVRVPGNVANPVENHGIVCLFLCLYTLRDLGTMSLLLHKRAHELSLRASSVRSVYNLGDAGEVACVINECIHPRMPPSTRLSPGIGYSTADHSGFVDGLTQTAATDTGVGGPAQSPFITAEMFADVCANKASHLLNPFLALNSRRICLTENILPIWPGAGFICHDADACIFQDDNSINFGLLPAGCRAFRINMSALADSTFFPDQLPLDEVLLKFLPQELRHVAGSMSSQDMRDAIIEGRPTGVDSCPFFINPVYNKPALSEEVSTGSMAMRYLSDIEARISKLRSSDVTEEVIREQSIRAFLDAVLTMSSDVLDTPVGPRSAAKEVLAGLRRHGLHFLTPKNRPCKGPDAYIAWILQELDQIGMLVHDVSIGMRVLLSVLTTFISDNGGVHLFFTGVPSDGKTFAITDLLLRVIPSMMRVTSASQRAFDSDVAGGMLRLNVLAWDDVAPGAFDKIYTELKILLGRKSMAGRLVNVDHMEPGSKKKPVGTIPAPCAVIMTSNFSLADVMADAEKGIVGSSAIASRMFNFRLNPVRLDDRDVGMLSNARGGEADEDLTSSRLRFFYACCTMVAICIGAKIIPTVTSPELSSTVKNISAAFKKLCPEFRSDDQRVQLHMQSLPVASAIMEQVFERIVMGGEHKPSVGPQDLCSVIYDISRSLVLSLRNIIFGVSMVLDSAAEVRGGTDLLLERLLRIIKSDWFDEERRGFVLDESAQSLLIREFETSSEKKQSMSFYKLVEPLITKTYQPLDGQTTPDRAMWPFGTGPNRIYVVGYRTLYDAMSKHSIIDNAIMDVMRDLIAEGEFTIQFLQFYSCLATLLDSLCGDSELVDAIRVRACVRAIRPSVHPEDRYNWLTAEFKGPFAKSGNVFTQARHGTPNTPEYDAFTKYRLQFSQEYIDQMSATDISMRIPTAIRASIEVPGQYSLCVPATFNVRVVEVVEVTQHTAELAAINNKFKATFKDVLVIRCPSEIRAKFPWMSTNVTITPALGATSYELGLFWRLLSMFHCIPPDFTMANGSAHVIEKARRLIKKYSISKARSRNERASRDTGKTLPGLLAFMMSIHQHSTSEDSIDALAAMLVGKSDAIRNIQGTGSTATATAAVAAPAAVSAAAVSAALSPPFMASPSFVGEQDDEVASGASHTMAESPEGTLDADEAASQIFDQSPPAHQHSRSTKKRSMFDSDNGDDDNDDGPSSQRSRTE